MSTSTVTRQPHLSSWNENPANNFLHPERAYFSVLPSNQRVASTLFSSRDWSFDSASLADLPLPTNYLFSFLPQQGCVGLNPQLMVRSGSLADGYSTPSPH
jgi:hypothetical protein